MGRPGGDPGERAAVVVDLAQGSAGAWAGSIVIPGLGIKGARAVEHRRRPTPTCRSTSATCSAARRTARRAFSAHLDAADRMTGEMRQAGNVAKFSLAKSRAGAGRGAAAKHAGRARSRRTVDRRVRARRLSAPRHDHARESRRCRRDARKFVIVGKQTNDLPVDLVVQDGRFAADRVAGDAGQRSRGASSEARRDPRHHRARARSSCRWCCAARREDVMKSRCDRALALGEPSRCRRRVSRRRCFAATPRTPAPTAATGRAQFHRVKWTFPTGDRIVSSPVYQDGVDLLRQRRRQRLRRGRGRRAPALEAHAPAVPSPSTPAVAGDIVYVGSYDGKFYALDAQTGAPRWKFATGGERRFEAKGLHGMLPKNQTIADPFDVFLSSPVVGGGLGVLRQRRRQRLRARRGVRRAATGSSRPATSCTRRRRTPTASCTSAAGTATSTRSTRSTGEREVALSRRRGSADPQPGRLPVVAGGRERRRLHRLPRLEPLRDRRRDRPARSGTSTPSGSWVISSPAVDAGQGRSSARRIRASTSCSTPRPASELVRQQGKAYMFSSPAVAGNIVYVGVLNGTLEARDLASGELLWEFQTEASKRNAGWVLTADRRFNAPLLFSSSWREAPIVATRPAVRRRRRSSRRRSSSAAPSTSAARTATCTRWSEHGWIYARARTPRGTIARGRAGAADTRQGQPKRNLRCARRLDPIELGGVHGAVVPGRARLQRDLPAPCAPVRRRRARRTRPQANSGIRGGRGRDSISRANRSLAAVKSDL